MSSRQNRVNVAQSGPDSSETADSAEEQVSLPQIVQMGETQLQPTEDANVYQEFNPVLIQFDEPEEASN